MFCCQTSDVTKLVTVMMIFVTDAKLINGLSSSQAAKKQDSDNGHCCHILYIRLRRYIGLVLNV